MAHARMIFLFPLICIYHWSLIKCQDNLFQFACLDFFFRLLDREHAICILLETGQTVFNENIEFTTKFSEKLKSEFFYGFNE